MVDQDVSNYDLWSSADSVIGSVDACEYCHTKEWYRYNDTLDLCCKLGCVVEGMLLLVVRVSALCGTRCVLDAYIDPVFGVCVLSR